MLLDVSEALLEPLFQEEFQYVRRIETVNVRGRSEVAETIRPGVGVICSASANDLQHLPEEMRMGRNLSIVTMVRLQGPSDGFKPDLVVWRGNRYQVKYVDVYSHAGSGFVQVIAGSVDSMDTNTQ